MKKYKIPVILYESEEQVIPYVEVQHEDEMAPTLFIQEYKHTGTFEPDESGDEQPVVEMSMHMFVDMEFLSKKVGPKLYDKVRTSIGLEPVKKARKSGQKILDKVYKNAEDNIEKALAGKDEKLEKAIGKMKLNQELTGKFFQSEEVNEEANN